MQTPNRRTVLSTLLAAAAFPATAQFKRVEGAAPPDSPADATFRMDVNVVNVLATVRNRNGQIVPNLDQQAFTILEDGRPQEIRYFTRQTDLPLTLGLLVDTSFSQRDVLEEEREASYVFFQQVLRPEGDLAFVIRFDAEVELLQDVTSSRPQLERALSQLQLPNATLQRRQGGGNPLQQAPPGSDFVSPFQIGVGIPFPGGRGRMPGGRRQPGPRRDPRSSGPANRAAGIGTKLYDAVYLASGEVLQKQSGRKALVLLSDGVDFGSKITEKAAVEAALRAESLVYGIHYGGNTPGGLFGGGRYDADHGKEVLESIAQQSGGRMFAVSGKQTLQTIYAELQEELRNQYSLGYTPTPGDAAYRKIEVKLSDPNLRVQARAGYYPKTG